MERNREDVLEYLMEARETLEAIEKELLLYEKQSLGGIESTKETLDTLFRHFHTIKGSSGFFGLSGIVKLAHATENLLDFLRKYPNLQDSDTLDLLIQSKDYLEELVSLEEEKETNGDLNSEHHWNFLATLNAKNEEVRTKFKSEENVNQPTKVEQSEFGLFTDPNIKNEQIFESKPNINLANQNPSEEFGLFSTSENKSEEFGLFSNPKGENVEFGIFSENLGKSISKTEVNSKPNSTPEVSNSEKRDPLNKVKIRKDIRIDTEKLDSLLDVVGEIVIAETLVSDHPEIKNLKLDQFRKTTLQLKKLIRTLQEVSLNLRMIPISGVFSRMERLVRDTAKKTGKLVNLQIAGEETEIDKSIVEEIYDPLVHILRNAIDHGLETPEERKEAGKSENGNLILTATQSGKEVWIQVKDDGKGLNRKKVLQKAIEQGLVAAYQAEQLSDEEVWEFLFHPGFSTAKQVSDLSGRGVGLDVVRKNVYAMNGFVDISSVYGQGTTFLIRVPLTLAIIEGMVVRKNEGFYIIPSIDIKETIYVENKSLNELYKNNHMFSYRNSMIPLVELNQLFGNDSELNSKQNIDKSYVIITENQDKQMGILFDEILGNQSIVIKPISPLFKNIQGLAGCTILGNGQAGLILDVKKLITNHILSDVK